MRATDVLRAWRWKLAGHHTRPLPPAFAEPLAGARVLELGGPSAVFGAGGLLPVYPLAAGVDNVQWSADTAWHGRQDAGPYRHGGMELGRVRVLDDIDLAAFADGSYDAVISSHVIEHFANPLRALAAWRRVTGPAGIVLAVVPHKAGTFDHRRPVTTLEHLVHDYEAGTGEDDLTHVSETLALHDHRRDADPDDRPAWEAKRRDNPRHRLVHHHVFTTPSLVRLLDRAGLQVEALETRWPHDIYALGRFGHEQPDNARWLDPRSSPALQASPFRVDRDLRAGLQAAQVTRPQDGRGPAQHVDGQVLGCQPGAVDE